MGDKVYLHISLTSENPNRQAFYTQTVDMEASWLHEHWNHLWVTAATFLSRWFLANNSICKTQLSHRKGAGTCQRLIWCHHTVAYILAIRSRLNGDSHLAAGSHTGSLDFSTPKNMVVSWSNWPLSRRGLKETSRQFLVHTALTKMTDLLTCFAEKVTYSTLLPDTAVVCNEKKYRSL